MPATFAHPAVVLPLASRLPLSALVVGSIAPDLFYLIPPLQYVGHTLSGLFVACLPLGLLVLAIFHALKPPVIRLLALPHAGRLAKIAPPKVSLAIPVAILIGATSHLIWDGFTHSYGWATVRWPSLLARPILESAVGTLRVYKLLQHGSTILGSAFIALAYARWYRDAAPDPSIVRPPHATRFTLALLALSLVAAVIWGGYRASDETGFRVLRVLVVQGFAAAAVVSIAGLTAYAIRAR